MAPESALARSSDRELVAACRRGDREAWSVLLSRYERLIWSVPHRYRLPDHERADVFQTTCVRLLEHLPKLRKRDSIASWLLTTTARVCWERTRRKSRRAAAAPRPASPSAVPDPHEIVTELEDRALVRAALARLPERCRRIVELTFLASPPPTYREIAEELGIPEGSIGPTRLRCLKKLRRILEDTGM
jgi:RNA polymerase sigma factor (sigma-70 family)